MKHFLSKTSLRCFCLLLLVAGCTTRGRVTQWLKRSEKSLQAGDEALGEQDWSRAKERYEETDQLLKKAQQGADKFRGPIQEKHRALSEQIGHRKALFGPPQEALKGIVRIAGIGQEDLLRAVWNPAKAAQKVVGQERWTSMDPSTKAQLVEVTHALIAFAVGTNLNFYQAVEQDVQDVAIEEERDTATLKGVWRYGSTQMTF